MLTRYPKKFKGVVKWYNPKLKFGFAHISPKIDDITKGAQIFIHENDIAGGTKCVFENELISFTLIEKETGKDGRVRYQAVEICKIRSGSDYISVFGQGADF